MEYGDEFSEELKRGDEGLEHGWRIAAWCREVGLWLRLPPGDVSALERAAVLLAARAGDVRDEGDRRAVEIYEVRKGRRETVNPALAKLALILEQCEDLDNGCEMDALMVGTGSVLEAGIGELAGYLREVSEADVERLCAEVPVFPGVARRVLGELGNEKQSFRVLEDVVSEDATIAGHVVAAANTAAMPGQRVETIRDALARVGVRRARKVVWAAALRNVFGGRHCERLWNHSLMIAQQAAEIIRVAGSEDPDKGFLAGLVHDVGELALVGLPAEIRARDERLCRAGCPDVVVERVLYGYSHGAIGAWILRAWNFAAGVVEAVEHHHAPEQSVSRVCAAVYLAERLAGFDGGVPSAARDEMALGVLRLRSLDAVRQGAEDVMFRELAYTVGT